MKKLIAVLMMAFAVVAISCADKSTDPENGNGPEPQKPPTANEVMESLGNIGGIKGDCMATGKELVYVGGIVNTLLNSTQEPHQKKKNLVVYF